MARTGGKLTAKQLSDLLKPYTNSKHHEKLHGSGFFDKISGIIDLGKKVYGAVDKGIKIGTKGYGAYKSFKTAADSLKVAPEIQQPDLTGFVTGVGSMVAKKRGGKLTGGAMTGGAEKKKRVLPPALRERAKRMGELMRDKKMTMKQASEEYAKEKNK
jgi:hypothetical protein